MTQYLSRADKPIPTRLTWGREGLTELPEDWICERINVTQWGEAIGEQAAYSCWCEAALMLTWTDLPGLYWNRDSDRVTVFDHVTAQVRGGRLELHNPTAFDCRVKILAETAADRAPPYR